MPDDEKPILEPDSVAIAPSLSTALAPERPTLRGWIAKVTEPVDGEMEVNSIRIQGRSRQTESWKTLIDVRRKRDEEVVQLIERVEMEVSNQTARQLQCIAYRRQGRVPISSYPIIADIYGADDDYDDDEVLTKGKAVSEVVRQTLRHNEVLVHAVMKMCATQSTALATIVDRYEKREAASESRHLEAIDALRTLQLADREGAADEAKWRALTQSAQEIASAIAFRMTAGAGKADHKSEIMSAALKRLGSGLTDAQAETIGRALRPEQAAILRSLLEDPDQLVEAVEKREAELAEQRENPPNEEPPNEEPADDAPAS